MGRERSGECDNGLVRRQRAGKCDRGGTEVKPLWARNPDTNEVRAE